MRILRMPPKNHNFCEHLNVLLVWVLSYELTADVVSLFVLRPKLMEGAIIVKTVVSSKFLLRPKIMGNLLYTWSWSCNFQKSNGKFSRITVFTSYLKEISALKIDATFSSHFSKFYKIFGLFLKCPQLKLKKLFEFEGTNYLDDLARPYYEQSKELMR